MLSRRQEIVTLFSQFLDALLLGAVFWVAHYLRWKQFIIWDDLWAIGSFSEFVWLLAIIMPFTPFLLEMQGFYNYPLEKTVWKSLRQITGAAVWMAMILGLAVIFLRLQVPSRSVLLLFALFATVALLIRERIGTAIYRRRLERGAVGERVVLAGEPDSMRNLLASFTPTLRLELRIVAEVNLEVLGIEALVETIHRHSVGRVILAFDRIQLEKVQRAIEACETEGVEAWLSADFIRTSVARPTYETLARRPMLVFRTSPEMSWAMLIKATMDRVGGAVGLILFCPLFILVAILVKSSSKGPAFFRQRRAGLHGESFNMWKFRTMVVDAESQHDELAMLNEMKGPVFKIHNDPRITKIGRFLRRTSIDELPQFLNVLRGEMSLVGPRPLPTYEVEKFERAAHRRRLSMRPGLTCLWQIRGRNKVTDFDDWVRMDLEYIDNWSIALDMYILLCTVPVVLLARGAK